MGHNLILTKPKPQMFCLSGETFPSAAMFSFVLKCPLCMGQALVIVRVYKFNMELANGGFKLLIRIESYID